MELDVGNALIVKGKVPANIKLVKNVSPLRLTITRAETEA